MFVGQGREQLGCGKDVKKQSYLHPFPFYDRIVGEKEKESKGKIVKYRNVRTEYNGVVYDSRLEARKAQELDLMERAGIIKNLEKQKKFVLQEKYVNNKGEKIREIAYVADFTYEKDGVKYAVDTKGFKTEVYKIKKKLFEHRYKDYVFIEEKNVSRRRQI